MALANYHVVRKTDSANRIVDVLSVELETADRTAALTAYGALTGTYDIVSIDGSGLTITDPNDLIGQYAVATEGGAPTAWTQSASDETALKRATIHFHLARAYRGFSALYSTETSQAIDLCRRYFLKIFATASSDTIINNSSHYDILEEAAKVDSVQLFKALMGSATIRGQWDTALKGAELNFYGVDASYAPSSKAGIAVPASWDTQVLESVL